MACSGSLAVWCECNGLNETVLAALQEQGAQRFQDLLELSGYERSGLVEALDLRYFDRAKLADALSWKLTELYEQSLTQKATLQEYMERKKSSRTTKRHCQHDGGKQDGYEDDAGKGVPGLAHQVASRSWKGMPVWGRARPKHSQLELRA